MSEFDGIEGFDAWRAKLRSLLVEAEAAAQDQDPQVRFRISQRLTEFMEHSFPNDELVRKLDAVAREVAESLLDQTIHERLQSIVSANAELAALAKSFAMETEGALDVAARLRLERANKALETLNAGIAALKDLASALKPGDDDSLRKSVDQTVKVAKQLRQLLETV
jgi:hypothetical protein